MLGAGSVNWKGRGGKEDSVLYFEVLYEHLSGETWGNHENNEVSCPGRGSNLAPPICKLLCPHIDLFVFATVRLFWIPTFYGVAVTLSYQLLYGICCIDLFLP